VYKAHDFAKLDAPSRIIEGKYGPLDYISDILAIPQEDNTFDVILNTEVLEHIPEPFEAITEMHRLLKPGGKLILTAPLGSFLHQKPYHFYGGFTPYWYERYLAKAGFANIKVESNGGFCLFFGQECQRVTRILFRSKPLSSPLRWLLLPLEAVFTLLFSIACPFVCYYLDKLFRLEDYTVGYHVTAQKKQEPAADVLQAMRGP